MHAENPKAPRGNAQHLLLHPRPENRVESFLKQNQTMELLRVPLEQRK